MLPTLRFWLPLLLSFLIAECVGFGFFLSWCLTTPNWWLAFMCVGFAFSAVANARAIWGGVWRAIRIERERAVIEALQDTAERRRESMAAWVASLPPPNKIGP